MVNNTSLYDRNFSLLPYVSILFATIGITWLALNNVEAGQQFITLYLVAIGTIVLSFFFLRSDDTKFARDFIKAPFTTDLDLSVGLYLLGAALPLLIKVFGLAIGNASFSITAINVPLSAAGTVQSVGQAFSAVQATVNPFWNLFITVFVAGTIEEFIFGFVAMVAGFLVAQLIINLISPDKKGFLHDNKKVVLTLAAIGFSMFFFAGAHALNASYTTLLLFLFAALFRGLLNGAIFFSGLFLSFNIGFHQANNFVWYAETFGQNAVISAIATPQGIVIAIFYLLLVVYALRRFTIIVPKVRKAFLG